MFSNSVFKVIHLSPEQMQVVSPAHFGLAFVFVIPAALGLGYMLWRSVVLKELAPALIGIGWACFWSFFALMCVNPSNSLLLNATAGIATIDQRKALPEGIFRHVRVSIPLAEIRAVKVNTTTAAERIVLVLDTGKSVGFTMYTNDTGQEEAAQAIRDFLAAHGNMPNFSQQ